MTSRHAIPLLIAIGFFVTLSYRHSAQLLQKWSALTADDAQNEERRPATLPKPRAAIPPLSSTVRHPSSGKPHELILVRTLTGRSSADSRAFIGTDAANPQTYANGAILANGARITEIRSDHIVLARDGKLSKMYVGGSERAPAQEAAVVERETIRDAQPAIISPQLTEEVLVGYIRPSPVYDGQTLRGYQVYRGRVSYVFSQMGLKNGDVVLSIDGAPLSDPNQAMSLFRQLASGQTVLATIERAGQRQSLRLDGSLILNDHLRSQTAMTGADTPLVPSSFQ